jgi:peptide/nickel transport system permease protein
MSNSAPAHERVERIDRPALRPSTGLRAVWRVFTKNRLATAGAVGLILIWGAAVLAPWVAPQDPLEMQLDRPLLPPGTDGHPLGTDNFGRDTLSRLMFGARTSLLIGFVVVGIAAVIGMCVGIPSAYYGRWVDILVMRVADVFFAFPFLILAIGVIAVLGPSLFNLMAVLGLVSWPTYARLVRSRVLSLTGEQFVEAARAVGASDLRIMSRHLLPNAIAPVIVLATLGMAGAILAASALSFLGMGIRPPAPEWGSMLNEARPYMRRAPAMIITPGLAIMMTVLALNFVGDGLRDALDPRLRSGGM